MTNLFFIYSNLKVHPFIGGQTIKGMAPELYPTPFPGFELLSWEAYTMGTLWNLTDIDEAGFTLIGHTKVFGQLWKLENEKEFDLFEQCVGKDTLTEKIEVDATIPFDFDSETLKATTYSLQKILPKYEILSSGRWKF